MFLVNLALIVIFLQLLWIFMKKIFLIKICDKIKTVNGENLEDVVPIVPGVPILGNYFQFTGNDLMEVFYFLRDCAKTMKKSYLFYFIKRPAYNVITAEEAENVLSNPNLLKKGMTYILLWDFLGFGLLTSSGEKWSNRRKLLTPAFHFTILQTFLEMFREESKKFLDCIDEHIINDKTFCLTEAIPRFTLNIVCEAALGVKLDDMVDGDEYRRNVHILDELITRRSVNPSLYNPYLNWILYGTKQYCKALDVVHNFSSNIIKKRRSSVKDDLDIQVNDSLNVYIKPRYAMLDTLLAAEKKGQIDHEGICEEVDTFMFEGYDTTSVGLIFSLFMLSHHPEIQKKAFDEINEVLEDGEELTMQNISQLKYVESIIKESLRLYPSVPFIGREVVEDTVVGNLILPAGCQIMLHIYDIHHDAKHYEKPDEFIPERFLPENSHNRHPFAYIPFSGGSRNCIGQKFAMLEMKTLLSSIIRNYEILHATEKEHVTLKAGIILRSVNPILVKFVRRNKKI